MPELVYVPAAEFGLRPEVRALEIDTIVLRMAALIAASSASSPNELISLAHERAAYVNMPLCNMRANYLDAHQSPIKNYSPLPISLPPSFSVSFCLSLRVTVSTRNFMSHLKTERESHLTPLSPSIAFDREVSSNYLSLRNCEKERAGGKRHSLFSADRSERSCRCLFGPRSKHDDLSFAFILHFPPHARDSGYTVVTRAHACRTIS